MRADKGVGVGRVSNDANLHSLLGDLVDGSTLSLENLCVRLKQVSSLHAGASWSCANKNSNISVLKTNHRVSRRNNLLHASVGAIVQLHHKALKDFLSLGELNELKDNLLVRSKHSSLSNEVAEESADLASSASDSDADGSLLKVTGHGGEVAAELLKTGNKNVLVHLVHAELL